MKICLIALILFVAVSTPAAAQTKLRFRIQAIALSDDDGRNRANIDSRQLDVWVARANHTFAEANVEFLFKPGEGDLVEHRSTLLNRMEIQESHLGAAETQTALKIVSKYPTKVVVFFRHGANKDPSGSGFANRRFIVMAGFEDAKRCGQQYPSLMAHELGHYFGLEHTFQRVFGTVKDADAWVRQMEAARRDIDGDGLRDTSPVPMIWKQACGDNPEVTLAGHPYRLPRGNVMSYYQSGESAMNRKTITRDQAAVVRRIAVTLDKQMNHRSKKK